jgi:hypothetical protein
MNHPDDPGCRVLERNYDPEAAVAYALTQTEEGYKEAFKKDAVEYDHPIIDQVSLCTIFVMDSVITGGGWDSGLPEDQITWSGQTPFNHTDILLAYVEYRDDVEIYYHDGDIFNAEDFHVGDIILYEQGYGWANFDHAAFVTDVNQAANTVWVHEMSGSAGPGGRAAWDTSNPIYKYVIIRIDEFIEK